jgi:hypothetical protein
MQGNKIIEHIFQYYKKGHSWNVLFLKVHTLYKVK